MRGIKYSALVESELEQVIALLKNAGLNPKNMNVDGVVAARCGNRLLGCGRIVEMEGGIIELASVAVAKDWRQKGIGRRIIKAILRREKRRPIYLICRDSNRGFYEKLGFQEIDKSSLPAVYRDKFESIQNRPEYLNIKGLTMIKY